MDICLCLHIVGRATHVVNLIYMANILLVDDNQSLQSAYSSFLEHEGHSVTVASTVSDALAYLAANTPDLILLDMLMPKVNGLELLQQYDIQNVHKDVKVIVLSNLTELGIQEEAESLGARHYLNKSRTTPEELIATVNAVLAG